MRYADYRCLQTDRLMLRRFRMEDAPNFFTHLVGNEEVTKTMLWNTHREIRQSKESIRKVLDRYETGNFYCWVIALRNSDELIGRIDLLRFNEADDSCSFAYMVSPDHWNQGYGTEALKAVFAFAFEALNIERIEAEHFADNPASGAVMAKAGMKKAAIAAGKYVKDGIRHDAVQYCITKKDWINR